MLVEEKTFDAILHKVNYEEEDVSLKELVDYDTLYIH